MGEGGGEVGGELALKVMRSALGGHAARSTEHSLTIHVDLYSPLLVDRETGLKCQTRTNSDGAKQVA